MFPSSFVANCFSRCTQIRYASTAIVAYNERHYPEVQKIAMGNLSKLLSVPCTDDEAEKKECFNLCIRPLLQETSCLMSLRGEQPVAFLTHSEPTTKLFRTWVKIEHFATDSMYRNEGHGSRLLTHALTKFHEEEIQFVSVELTDLSLKKYYAKFGFKPILSIQTKTNTYAKLVLKLGAPAESFPERVVDRIVRYEPKIRFLVYYALYLLPLFALLKTKKEDPK